MSREDQPLRNHDVDWDGWPVTDYLDEIYRRVHPSDDAIIAHHSAFYRRLPPHSVDESLELGAGPNLYPLMLAAAVSRRIDIVEPSAASRAYLRAQCRDGAEASWEPFYQRCRELQPALPATLAGALSRVRIRPGRAEDLEPGRYGLVSMHFVAESCTESLDEFAEVCAAFAAAARPGGYVVAAFMENMGRYRIGTSEQWPGVKVDTDVITAVFEPRLSRMSTSRIDFDPTGPDYGYTGMVVLTGVR